MERRLTAILAADVVGYSRLMELDEAGTLTALKAHREELIDPTIAEHRGRIVKLMGDGALVEFASVVDAVTCAAAIQKGMTGRNDSVAEDRHFELRIGVHLGDIIVEGEDIYGEGVNVAARLEGMAEPGGICLSGDAYRQVRGKVEVDFEDLGEREVKNLAEPLRVYRIAINGPSPAPTLTPIKPLPLPDKPSIAVLPFDNMTGDPEQEFFADGIAEDVTTALSRFHSLFVVARNSSFSYKGTSPDIRTVARELGVRYVVEGSVRMAGNRVRITAQLIDATSGNHLWANRFDGVLDDVFDLQDQITEQIVVAVEPEIGARERERARRKPPENLDAWECYQRGLWQIFRFTLEDIVEAKSLFQRAIRLDPDFATAHSGLAYALFQEWMYSDPENRRPLLDQAQEAAQASIVIDDHDAMAHFVRCRILASRGDFRSAYAEGEKAIDLNPSFAYAYFGLGHALSGLRSFEEALKMFETAARLSPRDPHNCTFIHYQAFPLIGLECYEEAVEVERRALLSPNASFFFYVPLISALGHLERKEEAKEAIGQLLRLQPGYTCTSSVGNVHWDGIDEKLIDGLRRAGLPD